jgi:hypothetical protein
MLNEVPEHLERFRAQLDVFSVPHETEALQFENKAVAKTDFLVEILR